MVLSFMRACAEMQTLPVGGCTLKWTFLMFLSTTSTEMPPTSICLVFMLLEDDLEDALDLIPILQDAVQRRLDHLLTSLNSAPAVGAHILNRSINLQCPRQSCVTIHKVDACFICYCETLLRRF